MVNILDSHGHLLARCTPDTAARQVARGHARTTDHPLVITAVGA